MKPRKIHIEIELPDTTLAQVQKFVEHWALLAYKTKRRFVYRIEAEEGEHMKFYWLGTNMANGLLNKLNPSSLSRFIEL